MNICVTVTTPLIRCDKKPNGKETANIQTRLINEGTFSVEECADYLCNGGVIRPALCISAKSDSFVSQQIFLVDIDNSKTQNNNVIPLPVEQMLTVQGALDLCDEVGLKPAFIYYSFSNGKEVATETGTVKIPKFRIAFVFDEVITDVQTRDALQLYLMLLFGDPDQSEKEASRLFFGSQCKEPVYSDYEAVNILEDLIDELEPFKRDKSKADLRGNYKQVISDVYAEEQDIMNALEKHDAEFFKQRYKHEELTFNKWTEAKNYIMCSIDLCDFLGWMKPRHDCIYRDGDTNSMTCFQTRSGVWWLYCHHNSCVAHHGRNIIKVVEYIGNFESEYTATQFLLECFNINISRSYYPGRLKDSNYINKECQNTLYNVNKVIKAIDDGYPVHICMNKKDADTLFERFLWTASASTEEAWAEDFNTIFRGATVTIWANNDDAGNIYANQIQKSIRTYAYKTRVVTISKLDHGCITDYFEKENGTNDSLNEAISNVEYTFSPFVYESNGKERINADILSHFITKQEDYIIANQPNDERDRLYNFQSGVYNRGSKNCFIAEHIKPYFPLGSCTNTNVIESTYKLLMASGKKNISWESMDEDETYINMKNGLLNIETGILEKHDPKIISTIQLPIEFDNTKTEMPYFEKFINDLATDEDGKIDSDIIKVLQEYGGFIVSNICMKRIKKALFLWSIQGNTGKSTFVRILSRLVNDKTSSIDLKTMDNSSRNKFNLGSISGTRFIECGDQGAGEINDSSVFKRLTGGDKQNMEEKGKQGVSKAYNGGMIISCNEVPYFSDDSGKHIFDRMLLVKLRHSVPMNERDRELEDKIIENELQAVFNWFLEGLYRLKNNGYIFSDGKSLKNAMEEYRSRGDSVYRYLTEFYEITFDDSDIVTKSEFEAQYQKWAIELNSSGTDYIKPVMQKNIAKRMLSYGFKEPKTTTINGKPTARVYRGFRKKEFVDADLFDEKIPFESYA